MSKSQTYEIASSEKNQKDKKISELHDKLEKLKQQSKDYDSLNSQYKQLLNDFTIMKEANHRLEYEIRQRELEYNRRISDLKAENETLKLGLNDKMTNSRKINSENDIIEKEIILKNEEIKNLNNRLSDISYQFDKDFKDNNDLVNLAQNLHNNIIEQNNKICKLKEDNINLTKICQENEKYLKLGENDSKKYIIKNKEALYDYNKLLKKMKDPNFMNGKYNNYQETKDIFNIQYNTPNFKKNPKQIINSYNIELIGKNFEKKIKYKSRILGVDEGLIELPKVFSDPNINLFKTTVQTEDKKKKKNQSRNKIMQENSKENTKAKKAFSFDKIIEKEKKNKINERKNKNKDLIEEEQKKFEKYQNSIQMINEIKKLDSWDMRHAYKGIRRYQTHGTMRHILSSLGQGNMRWLLDIKNDPQKLKIISRNNYLKDFFNKIDQNQNAIFMQSLNIQKEEFNFDVFEKGNFNHEKDEILRKKRENQIDYYREAIKEKIKVEDILKNDLANIAQGIYDAKIEKKKLIVQLYDESLKINEIHKKKIKLKEEFDEKMEEIKNDLLIDNNNTIVTPRKKNDKGKNLSMRKEQLLK